MPGAAPANTAVQPPAAPQPSPTAPAKTEAAPAKTESAPAQPEAATAQPAAPETPPSAGANQTSIQLSAGVALPQTGPDGTLMSFSVDYEFAQGEPSTDGDFWVIERAHGKPLRQQNRLTSTAISWFWFPAGGPRTARSIRTSRIAQAIGFPSPSRCT